KVPSRSRLLPRLSGSSVEVEAAGPGGTTQCALPRTAGLRSEEHTSELQSRENLVCRLLLEKKNRPTGARLAPHLRPVRPVTLRRAPARLCSRPPLPLHSLPPVFFQCAGAPRVLHPFPTRRSSDLEGAEPLEAPPAAERIFSRGRSCRSWGHHAVRAAAHGWPRSPPDPPRPGRSRSHPLRGRRPAAAGVRPSAGRRPRRAPPGPPRSGPRSREPEVRQEAPGDHSWSAVLGRGLGLRRRLAGG